jgi:ferredoxin
MKVRVDQQKCLTVGVCVQVCPEVFRFHEGSKKAYAMMNEVPPAQEEAVLRAAKECPEKAIIIEA